MSEHKWMEWLIYEMHTQNAFFEISIKNYIYGDAVLEIALAADQAAQKYDIDVLTTTPYTEIRKVAEQTERLIVLAHYMDTLRPGRGMADILPEAIKAAGAKGVAVNHCERPMALLAIKKTKEHANELSCSCSTRRFHDIKAENLVRVIDCVPDNLYLFFFPIKTS